MENQEFDQFTRETAGAPTRRTVFRGLAAILGASVLGLSAGLDADADKSKQKKRKQRRRKQEKKYECGSKGKVCAAPTNPCQTASCEKHKCVTSNVANGTTCGNGLACNAGQCVCPGGTCVVEVTPSALLGWAFYNEATNEEIDPKITFGPDEPPFGSGSANLKIAVDAEKKMVSARVFNGTRLADLSELSYWTYVQSSDGNTAPSFQIGITRDIENPLNGFESRLVFTPSIPDVVPGEWQEWNLLDSANNPPSFFVGKGEHPNVPFCTQSIRCTFAQVLEHYPNIAINPVGPSPSNEGAGWGFIGAMVGSFEGAVNANVDGITIAVEGSGSRTIYNFERNS
jgi:hypothetical protein